MNFHRPGQASSGPSGPGHGPETGGPQLSVLFSRKEPLANVREGGLYVWDAARDAEMGVIVQLGEGGLVFEYFDVGWRMDEAGRFDLLTDAGLCISAIAYRLLSDESVEDEGEDPSPVPIRRSRVAFEALDTVKRNAIESLLSVYATQEP